MHHKPICLITLLLVVVGGINWGLVGLGGLLDMELNIVHLLLGTWPSVEYVVYLLVGLAALKILIVYLKCGKQCAYEKCK